ncbi:MAG: hypothetical protein KatS3mg113_0329 [Planctomycetaceae bacterium]|nr:MAG: hypothetical protein KatS3mg113_0329 [Planctomycetaceae bacterium]
MAGGWTRRAWLSSIPCGVLTAAVWGQEKIPVTKGKLTDESLGSLLRSLGLEPQLQEKRYDFTFKSTIGDEDWDLSMSAVLSQDQQSIWVMAWLDECPKSAADVPRLALLRLLAQNDRLGKGKFFAYIPSNRRFVLQRVIPNEQISAASFRAVLDDLGASVVETYPYWSVANWTSTTLSEPTSSTPSAPPSTGGSSRQPTAAPSSRPPSVPQSADSVPSRTSNIK